jgi:hypothetical protein
MSRWLGGRGLWAERASRTIDSFLALMDGREGRSRSILLLSFFIQVNGAGGGK